MKLRGGTWSPEKFRRTPLPDGQYSRPDLNPRDGKLHRRRPRKQDTPRFGVRLRKYGAHALKPSGGATTPLLKWKFDGGEFSVAGDNAADAGRRGFRRVSGSGAIENVSARKLAAGMWQWRLAAKVSAGGNGKGGGLECGPFDRLGFEPGIGHANMAFPSHCNGREYGAGSKDTLRSPYSVSGAKNGILYKLDSSLPYPKSTMEGATKWDPGWTKSSEEVYRFYSHMKLLEDQQVTTVSVISALQAKLVQARSRIHKLEAERQSSKKKLEHFLKKIDEEKTTWRRKEHQKIHALINDLKDELNTERKSCQRMEIVNSKLVNELADAKLSLKQFMQNYEKETKARELMEEVCNELAKEIGEDKAEVEALKRESMKIHEEVEEERKMLQLAEVWREERVHMKLVDAKLILEEKYTQMNNLAADLDTFVRSRIVSLDVKEMREAETLRQAVSLVNIQDIQQFSYTPSKSDDIFSIFEDLQIGETRGREMKPCVNYISTSHVPKLHTAVPEANGFNINPVQENSNGYIDHNRGLEEDASGWATVSEAEDQGSSYSTEGSDSSVDRISQGEISEVCSISIMQSKKGASAAANIWRSCPSDGEIYKLNSVEGDGRLSKGTISNVGTISPVTGSVEGGLSHRNSAGQCGSQDLGNPHIARGMKGCIERPQGVQKTSLKAKLLEARVESQKIQMRHVLKKKS